MTTEPMKPTPAAAGTPAAAAVPAAAKRFKYDPRYTAPLFITCILLGAHFSMGGLKSPFHTGAAIVTALMTEAILGRIHYGKIPHMASAYVSGLSAGILVRTEEIWPFALTAAIAIASKYVLRVKGRHIWNPTNFAIGAMLLVGHQHFAVLGADLGNSLWPVLVIWTMGTYIVHRVKRLQICATYVAGFLFFAWVRTLVTGHTYWAEVAPLTGPMYQLFVFFMITDPKTTVLSLKGQVATAFCISAAECLLRLAQVIHAPFFALFIVGPIAMLIEIWRTSRKPAAAPPSGGTPAPARS